MDKNKIYKIAFETIKESTDWGTEDEGKTYGNWVDGAVTVVDALLDEFEEEKNGRPVEN